MTYKVESGGAFVILIAGTTKKLKLKVIFCWHLEGHCRKEQDSDLVVRGPDPDPYQNVTDPEHWFKETEA
jgi:hypothetical protein